MKNYSITTSEELRSLCIRNNWFTEGTNGDYDRLFHANELGCSIEEIATIIWLHSDFETDYRGIIHDLKEAQEEHLVSMG